jgi:hypothetical protein
MPVPPEKNQKRMLEKSSKRKVLNKNSLFKNRLNHSDR